MGAPTADTEGQRQVKWLAMTETINRQINEARNTASQIRDAGGFILRQAAPTPEAVEKAEEPSKELDPVENRRTVDNSPLSIRLNSLRDNLSTLNNALSEIVNLIDV